MLTLTSRSFLPHKNKTHADGKTNGTVNYSIPQEDPDKGGWEDTIRPEPGEERQVEVGRRSGVGTDDSISITRQRLDGLDFHAVDPYVASVASGVAASQLKVPGGGESKVRFHLKPFFEKRVEVRMGTHNGPGAPMLVILPGVYGNGKGGHAQFLKKIALERGMNYLAIPNSLGMDSLRDDPRDHPGNPRMSAMACYKAVQTLKDMHPGFFDKVSLAGYSYGALNGANIVRYEEELMEQNPDMERLITGSLVGVSPPENLAHSMLELDGLREHYKEGAGSIIGNGLKYKRHVRRHGYSDFMKSELAARGPGENITEIKIADKYGSRGDLKKMVNRVDKDFGHQKLPMNKPGFGSGTDAQQDLWRRQHAAILKQVTYAQFSDHFMAKDQWLNEQGLTPDQMAAEYSFSKAMDVIDDTPVMVLLSADDYILNDKDVSEYRKLEADSGDLEAVKVFEHGGHVGLTWNPEVQEVMGDFLFKAPRS